MAQDPGGAGLRRSREAPGSDGFQRRRARGGSASGGSAGAGLGQAQTQAPAELPPQLGKLVAGGHRAVRGQPVVLARGRPAATGRDPPSSPRSSRPFRAASGSGRGVPLGYPLTRMRSSPYRSAAGSSRNTASTRVTAGVARTGSTMPTAFPPENFFGTDTESRPQATSHVPGWSRADAAPTPGRGAVQGARLGRRGVSAMRRHPWARARIRQARPGLAGRASRAGRTRAAAPAGRRPRAAASWAAASRDAAT